MNNELCPVERFIGPRYKNAYLNSLFSNENDKKILKWIKNPRGILLMMGDKGTGKTHRCIAICRNLKERTKKPSPHHGIFYYDQGNFYDEFKEIYHNKWSDYSLKERHSQCLALCVDDFGMTANTQWQVEIMTDIINRRYNSKKPTIISTNLSFDDIENKFHARVRDRLEALENLILVFNGESYRQKGF